MNDATSVASWRKCLLLNRSALISAFGRAFPVHDFQTLRLIRSSWQTFQLESSPHWDGESWKRAARAYHEDRKRNLRRW
jgi:hypothetical protein